MSPGKARHILAVRRNWLAVKLEGVDPLEHWRDRAELAALDVVLAMLPAPSAHADDVQRAETIQLERARRIQGERARKCSCHLCPVHGRKEAAE